MQTFLQLFFALKKTFFSALCHLFDSQVVKNRVRTRNNFARAHTSYLHTCTQYNNSPLSTVGGLWASYLQFAQVYNNSISQDCTA